MGDVKAYGLLWSEVADLRLVTGKSNLGRSAGPNIQRCRYRVDDGGGGSLVGTTSGVLTSHTYEAEGRP